MPPTCHPDRRTLLAAVAGGAGLIAAGAPGIADAAHSKAAAVRLPGANGNWTGIRQAFALRPGLVHLNSANMAAASRAALGLEHSVLTSINADPSFENRAKYELAAEDTRGALARLLGADPDEIAITRNTSEGNRTVIAGLSLKPGDEVVIWSQNHESNRLAWQVWAERFGFTLITVETPPRPTSPDELVTAFASRLTDRTRILAFSHVSNILGVALPAEALCKAASARGVLTLVDGAQTFGMRAMDLHQLGCDFYTGSGHKWLAGPQETGVLYVRRSRIEALWPSMVTHNWDIYSKAGARKFECLGQRQDGRIDALRVAAERQLEIGPDRIETRIRTLAAEFRNRLRDGVPQAEMLTPETSDLNAGIVSFLAPLADAARLLGVFYNAFGISAMARPYADGVLVRLSPNIYNWEAEADIAVAATRAALKA